MTHSARSYLKTTFPKRRSHLRTRSYLSIVSRVCSVEGQINWKLWRTAGKCTNVCFHLALSSLPAPQQSPSWAKWWSFYMISFSEISWVENGCCKSQRLNVWRDFDQRAAQKSADRIKERCCYHGYSKNRWEEAYGLLMSGLCFVFRPRPSMFRCFLLFLISCPDPQEQLGPTDHSGSEFARPEVEVDARGNVFLLPSVRLWSGLETWDSSCQVASSSPAPSPAAHPTLPPLAPVLNPTLRGTENN